MSERPIRIGGLMRCCIETAREYDGDEVPGETSIPCKYEGERPSRVRLALDGVWEWDRG